MVFFLVPCKAIYPVNQYVIKFKLKRSKQLINFYFQRRANTGKSNLWQTDFSPLKSKISQFLLNNFSANLIKHSLKLVWRTLKNFLIFFTLPNKAAYLWHVSSLNWLHWIWQFLKSIHITLCNRTDVSLVNQSVFLKRGKKTYNNSLFRWNSSLFIVNNIACVNLVVLLEIPGTAWMRWYNTKMFLFFVENVLNK